MSAPVPHYTRAENIVCSAVILFGVALALLAYAGKIGGWN
jgi:hypothetical protein